MNTISKKLRELEQNVLELPEDEDINLYIGDEDEHLLHTRAEKIKENFRSDAGDIMFSGKFTFEQQNVKAEELFLLRVKPLIIRPFLNCKIQKKTTLVYSYFLSIIIRFKIAKPSKIFNFFSPNLDLRPIGTSTISYPCFSTK